MKFLVYSSLLALIFASCAGSDTKAKENTQQAITLAAQTDTLVQQACAADQSNTYWYFAPKQAVDTGALLIFFDAHGNGRLPIDKYLSEAKARNCIFIGSNALQNGLLANEQKYIIGVLLDDIRQRFLHKKRAIYLCGFSGGARTAARLAAENATITGVIANGAPINPQEQVQNVAMTYVAVVGTRDFNLLEVMLTENALKNAPFKHYIITHPGKHEWMPVDYFRLAFDVLEANANKSVAERCSHTIDTLLCSAKKQKDVEQQAALLGIANSVFAQMPFHVAYKKSFDSLLQQSTTQSFIAQQTQIYSSEMKQQDEYVQMYAQKDLTWWTAELKKLNAKAKQQTADGASAQRLLAFINMIGYVYVDKSMKQNAMADADRFWKLYHLSDSTNPDVYYLRAKYFVYTGKKDEVIPQLQLAISHGYSDKHALQTDDAFASYHNNPEFEKLLK